MFNSSLKSKKENQKSSGGIVQLLIALLLHMTHVWFVHWRFNTIALVTSRLSRHTLSAKQFAFVTGRNCQHFGSASTVKRTRLPLLIGWKISITCLGPPLLLSARLAVLKPLLTSLSDCLMNIHHAITCSCVCFHIF